MSYRSLLFPALVLVLLPQPGFAQDEAAEPLPTLVESVRRALSTHPSLVRLRATVRRSEASADLERADRLPTVSAQGSAIRFEEPMVVAPIHSFDPTRPPTFDETLIEGRLALEWEILDFTRGPRIRAGVQRVEAGRASLRDATARVIEGSALAHLGVVATTARLTASEARVEAAEAEVERAEQFFREGSAARVDVLRARAALEDARAERASARAALDTARAALEFWTGKPVASVDPAPPRLPEAATEGEVDPVELHPSLARLERERAAAGAALEAARRTRLPTLSGVGGLAHFASAEGSESTEWQAGLRLTLPLFTAGRIGSRVDEAAARLREIDRRLEEERRILARERSDASAAIAEADARLESLESSVRSWEEVVRVEELALREGAGVQSDLLAAQAALFRARAARAAAGAEVVASRIRDARARALLTPAWLGIQTPTAPTREDR